MQLSSAPSGGTIGGISMKLKLISLITIILDAVMNPYPPGQRHGIGRLAGDGRRQAQEEEVRQLSHWNEGYSEGLNMLTTRFVQAGANTPFIR
jgi:hypothetical protein